MIDIFCQKHYAYTVMRMYVTIFISLVVSVMTTFSARADILPLDDALRATYIACVGIDEELSDLKQMAGINTAVTAVGTVAAGGATVVGLVKASKDKQAEELERLIQELRKLEEGKPEPTDAEIAKFEEEFNISYNEAVKKPETFQAQLNDLNKQSKRLGNWRTGLIAGSAATNIAGAIIAGNNKVNKDLQAQIDDCKASVNTLRNSMMQARIDGEDVSATDATFFIALIWVALNTVAVAPATVVAPDNTFAAVFKFFSFFLPESVLSSRI